jgi:mono/diheme cytochrome c family protein
MTEPTPSAQSQRETPDPTELHNRVPALLIVLALVVTGSGGYAIATSGLGPEVQFGDHRTVSTLSAVAGGAGGSAGVVDGATVFTARCAPCHQPTGTGLPGAFPPLAGSEWVRSADTLVARIVLHGIQGTITVAGTTYNGLMPAFKDQLSDAEIAAVTTYVRSQWGNSAPAITTQTVTEQRRATAARTGPWNGDADLTPMR